MPADCEAQVRPRSADRPPVRVALIGAGSIAGFHLEGLAHVPGADVRVVASRTAERAWEAARRFGVPEATGEVAGTIARPDIDAVVVTTPDATHEDIATAALRAGKAVLLQKPMAPTSAACRRLLAEAEASGRDLQVSWMHRHFAEVGGAMALMGRGALGRVLTVRLRNATAGPDWGDWFFRRDAVSGGVVHQLGVHGIDLVGRMFGPVETVSARVATLRSSRRLRDGRTVSVDNPDTAFALYRVRGGVLVQHEMSMIEAAGTDRFRMEIHGSEGTAWLRTERGALASIAAGDTAWTTHALPDEPMGRSLHRAWISGIFDPSRRESTARDALAGMRVAEAVLRSAAQGGAEVPVESAPGDRDDP